MSSRFSIRGKICLIYDSPTNKIISKCKMRFSVARICLKIFVIYAVDYHFEEKRVVDTMHTKKLHKIHSRIHLCTAVATLSDRLILFNYYIVLTTRQHHQILTISETWGEKFWFLLHKIKKLRKLRFNAPRATRRRCKVWKPSN